MYLSDFVTMQELFKKYNCVLIFMYLFDIVKSIHGTENYLYRSGRDQRL